VLGLLVLHQGRLAEALNLRLYDLALGLRPLPSAAALPIRVVAIEENDLRRLGWPLDDRHLVTAIRRLEDAGVRAIGLDLYRDLGVGEGREALRRLAAAPGALISVFSVVDGIGPIPGTPPERQAYNDVPLDRDGLVRRDLVHVRGQGPAVVALPLRLLEHSRGHNPGPLRRQLERDPRGLAPLDAQSGGYSDLDDAGLQRLLPFHDPATIPSWSLSDLLAGAVPPAALRDTLVLVGSRAPSQRDLFPVPIRWSGKGVPAGQMAGVDVHAQRLAALLARERGQRPGLTAAPGWLNGVLLIAALGTGVALGEGIGSLRRSVVAVALGGGAALAAGLAGSELAEAAWAGLWSPELRWKHAFFRFGLEKLMRFDEARLRHHFHTFFQLPTAQWTGFLTNTLAPRELLAAMVGLYGQAPWDVRWGLMALQGREGALLGRMLAGG
jgi:adenylate cyclase